MAEPLQQLVNRVLGGNHEFKASRLADSPVRVHGKGRGYEKSNPLADGSPETRL